MSYLQFIDLCILCGCDFTKTTIKTIGIKTALKLIKQHNNIENILEYLKSNNKEVPTIDEFNYIFARNQFINPKVKQVENSFFR